VNVTVSASSTGLITIQVSVQPDMNFAVTAFAYPGRLYYVVASDNGGAWYQIGSATAASNGVFFWEDMTPGPEFGTRLYRLSTTPLP